METFNNGNRWKKKGIALVSIPTRNLSHGPDQVNLICLSGPDKVILSGPNKACNAEQVAGPY